MNKYDKANVGFSGERKPLPVAHYGVAANLKKAVTTYPETKLRVIKYLQGVPTKNDAELKRHSWLVGATNGIDGTAFMSINLKDLWTTDEAIALAFNLKDVGDSAGIEMLKVHLTKEAERKVIEANTPQEIFDETVKETYKSIIDQIRINVGTIFRLQDWGGQERKPDVDLATLAGVEFAGSVEEGLNPETSNVKSVFSKPKEK